MTYRYYNIRSEINNDNSEKGLNGFRSFKELKSLYKPFHWIVFVGVILTFIGLFITLVILKNKLWCSIPLVILIILVNIWEYKCEKSYNQKARKNELDTIDEKYKPVSYTHLTLPTITSNKGASQMTYIIFKNNGINTRKELAALKNECNFIFDKRENKFKILSNKIFELLIGVPIGALISSLVDKNDALLHTKTILILMLGISIYVIITTAKYISYYTEGYRKDRRLLDAVMEMEYYFSIMEDNKIEKEVKEWK